MRAAQIDPETNIVLMVIEASNLYVLPNLILADGVGNVGDWWDSVHNEFIPPYDPRHPHYVEPEV